MRIQNRDDGHQSTLAAHLNLFIPTSLPLSRRHLAATTTICAVNPNFPLAFLSTNWTHSRERGSQQGPQPAKMPSPCRSRDADIRTSAASEGAPAHSPGTDKAAVRSGTNQLAHKHTSSAIWSIVMMHLSLTTMFPAQRPDSSPFQCLQGRAGLPRSRASTCQLTTPPGLGSNPADTTWACVVDCYVHMQEC